jgi:hypothetical protein
MDVQLRVVIPEQIAQLVQSLLASSDEHERSRTVPQLPRKLAADSGGSTGD